MIVPTSKSKFDSNGDDINMEGNFEIANCGIESANN
jgi:hypothetical protein